MHVYVPSKILHKNDNYALAIVCLIFRGKYSTFPVVCTDYACLQHLHVRVMIFSEIWKLLGNANTGAIVKEEIIFPCYHKLYNQHLQFCAVALLFLFYLETVHTCKYVLP